MFLTLPSTGDAPTAPGTPVATPISPTRVDLSWAPSTGLIGIAGYRVERCAGAGCTNFVHVGSPFATSFTDPGLIATTTYVYRVRAVNAASIPSGYSNTVTVTTPTPPHLVGLVAAYGFAEGAGQTSANISPSGNLLALNTATWTTQGKFGNALSFAGGQYATVNDSNSLDLTNALTLEAWVYPTAAPANWTSIVLKEQLGGMVSSMYTGAPSGLGGMPTAWGYVTTEVSVGATGPIPVNAWTHLATTFDGAQLKLFVNGVLAGTQALSGNLVTSNGALRIGGNTIWDEYFTGRIDEVRIFNRVLTESDIQADMNRPIDQPTSQPDTVPPSAPGTLTATAVTSTQIDLAWNASTDDTGVANYEVERCAGSGCSAFVRIATPTTTSYLDNTVAPSTTYVYRVRAVDASQNTSAYWIAATATTPAVLDTQAPGAPGTLTAVAASQSQINLGWGAATDNVGVIGYRVERCAGVSCATFIEIATPATTSYNDATAAASITYRYRVRAVDAAGNLGAYSNLATATTPDTQAPGAPGTLTATAASPSQINLGWGAATDNVGVTGYRVERCAGVSCANFAQIATSATASYNDATATASTTYSYRVRAVDAAVNLGTYSNIATATTPAVLDTQAPGAPGTLTAVAASQSQINLGWGAATDNVGVTGYRVERCAGVSCTNFAQIASPATTSHNDATAAASITYRYRVRAVDAAGNLGAYSNLATATTPDTQAPGAPGTLTATAASPSQINLGWGAATDNVGVTGYRVERCAGVSCANFAQIATPATTSYSDATATASTTYSYRVRAVDAAVNLGTYSNIATAATPAPTDTQAPGAPGTLAATAASPSQINLGWGAATDNVGVAGYRVERCAGAGCTTFTQIATPAGTTYNDASASAATT